MDILNDSEKSHVHDFLFFRNNRIFNIIIENESLWLLWSNQNLYYDIIQQWNLISIIYFCLFLYLFLFLTQVLRCEEAM